MYLNYTSVAHTDQISPFVIKQSADLTSLHSTSDSNKVTKRCTAYIAHNIHILRRNVVVFKVNSPFIRIIELHLLQFSKCDLLDEGLCFTRCLAHGLNCDIYRST